MEMRIYFSCKQYNAIFRISIDEIKVEFKIVRWPVWVIFGVLVLSAYWLSQQWLGPQLAGYSVIKEELIQTLDASGKIALPAPVAIVSKNKGNILALNVKEGQSVTPGQILLTLEGYIDRGASEKARAATALAEARFRKISEQTQAGSEHSIRQAKSSLEKARKQYAKTSELTAKGLVGHEQASDALRNLAIAQSQLATAQFQAKANRAKGSDYALAELALNKARANERALRDKAGSQLVKAESAGLVKSCKLAHGEVVLPGKTLMLLSPAGKAQVLVQLDEKNTRDIKLGQPASVVVEGHPEQRFTAALGSINALTESARGVVELKFEVNNPPDYLSQNMSVSLAIEVSRHADALSVPATAIRNAEGIEPWVMVADNGRAQRRMVKLGVRGKDKVEILEGLHEGDFVLPSTGAEVEEGKRIRLAKAG